MQVQSLGQKDALEESITTHSSVLVWGFPWTEKPGGLQSMGLQRVACTHSQRFRVLESLHDGQCTSQRSTTKSQWEY